MKATYFYSRKEDELAESLSRLTLPSQGYSYIRNTVNGKRFTDCQNQDGIHKSNWDDAIIVIVIGNLPIDVFMLKQYNEKFADTSSVGY